MNQSEMKAADRLIDLQRRLAFAVTSINRQLADIKAEIAKINEGLTQIKGEIK